MLSPRIVEVAPSLGTEVLSTAGFLFARVHLHVLDALLAVHLAAPHELAVALCHPALQPRVVAAAAAEQVTAVRVVGRVFAFPSARSQNA